MEIQVTFPGTLCSVRGFEPKDCVIQAKARGEEIVLAFGEQELTLAAEDLDRMLEVLWAKEE